MIVTTKQKLVKNSEDGNLNIHVEDCDIQNVEQFKYLGLYNI